MKNTVKIVIAGIWRRRKYGDVDTRIDGVFGHVYSH